MIRKGQEDRFASESAAESEKINSVDVSPSFNDLFSLEGLICR